MLCFLLGYSLHGIPTDFGLVLPSGYKHRPQIIMVEFPALPRDISRSSQLAENGMCPRLSVLRYFNKYILTIGYRWIPCDLD